MKFTLPHKILLFFTLFSIIGLSFTPKSPQPPKGGNSPSERFREDFSSFRSPAAIPFPESGKEKKEIPTPSKESENTTYPEKKYISVKSPEIQKILTQSFGADIQEGIIGSPDPDKIDDPYDNLFHIQIPESEAVTQAFLEYEVRGISGEGSVNLSINHEPAAEGVLLNSETKNWKKQHFPLNPDQVKPGDNTILFTVSENNQFSYKVRNLKIRLDNTPISQKETVSENSGFTTYKLEKGQPGHVLYQGAELQFPEGALPEDLQLKTLALRAVDTAPLNESMVNVTREHSGYRMLPHGTHFEKEITIAIPYDSTKIPQGYTPQDIRTYFFDENDRNWKALPKDSLDVQNHQIVSRTDHFTDFIAGILKVPESPDTAGYTPTSIKDIQAANPAAGIEGVSLPSANPSGSASTRFALKLPEGRAGLAPGLSLSYSSEAGNGWMGLGWNLNVSSIGIDTRWGTPRFDSQTESETYSLDGEMLTPTAHRSEIQNRTSDKAFYPRKEASYSRITRKGDSPKNYYWIIESKTGSINYYGGINQAEPSAVLKDSQGNIADWALVRTEDLNGNTIDYTYEIAENPAVSGGNIGYQRYIKQIRYTGTKSEPGKYTVEFGREQGRKDIQVSGRLGFKQVTADLLKSVTVKYDNQIVRSYELNYKSGRFYKTLLNSVTEKDTSGKDFYTHTFEYYDEVGDSNQVLTGSQAFQTPDENLSAGIIKIPGTVLMDDGEIAGFGDKTSALSGSKSSGYSAGSFFGVGVNDNRLSSKSMTIGGKFLYANSDNEVLVTMVDLNGDGLPDKVFKKDGSLYYRRNNGMGRFDQASPVTGVNSIQKSKSKTSIVGVEANPYIFFVGWQKSTTTTTTPVYFVDFNGDGLIDIAQNGQVWFNHINNQGDPVFTLDSNETPSPVTGNSQIDDSFIVDPTQEQQELIDNNPLHDVVKLWKAPFSGKIQIKSLARLIEDTSEEAQEYTHADGVQLGIQQNGNPLTATQTRIQAGDFISHPIEVSELSVTQGDRLYFRIQSVMDGNYDQVEWNPEIIYTQIVNAPVTLADTNADGLPYKKYNWNEDFTLSSDQQIAMPKAGTISVSGLFQKPLTSDDVTLKVVAIDPNGLLPETTLWEKTYQAGEAISQQLIANSLNITSDLFYSFRMNTTSNISWAETLWSPKITYTSFTDGTPALGLDGAPLLEMYPVVLQSQFSRIKTPSTGTYLAAGTYNFPVNLTFSTAAANGKAYLTVKQENRLLQSQELTISSGTASPASISFTVPETGKVYFECSVPDLKLGDQLTGALVNGTINAGISLKNDIPEFGSLYRGWGQFVYNGNKERASQPIHEAELTLDNYNTDNLPNVNSITDSSQLDSSLDPTNSNFIPMVPNAQQGYWQGADLQTYAGKVSASSSRRGEKDMTVDTAVTHNGSAQGLSAVIKKSKTTINSYAGGAGLGGFSGSYSETRSETGYRLDMMDFNGDRYPDVVDDKQIQYTGSRGLLSSQKTGVSLGFLNKGESKGGTLGGTFVPGHNNEGQSFSKTIRNAFRVSIPKAGEKANYGDTGSASLGISGNFSKNTDETKYSWMDLNGDGLPDKVYNDGNVELNIGYGFLPKENWGQDYIQEGKNYDYGAGLGVNWGYLSIGAGIGIALTDGSSGKTLTDVNGDGLPDLVDGNKVRLNTGAGFSSEVLIWNGLGKLGETRNVSQSVNASFTACFSPFVIPVKICVNPQTSANFGISRDQRMLTDINGDGFPDYVVSKEDGQMNVNYSTIGKTNLLKKVNQALGSTFTVDYKQEGNTYDNPGLKWVLASVETFDGHIGDGVDTMKTTFDYENGYYDRNERQFYGFATVKTHQIDTQINEIYRTSTEEYYNRDYYRNGLLKTERLEDKNGKKYTQSQTDYVIKDAQSGADISESSLSSMTARIFIAPKQTTQYVYEGTDTPVVSSANYTYNTLGNVLTFEQKGDGSQNQWAQAQMQYFDYQHPYLAGVLKSNTVSTTEGIKRKIERQIDPATGNLTQIKQFLESGEAAVYDFAYDTYGNPLKITGPANTQGQRMWKGYTYDAGVHTYPVQVKDAFGYTSTTVYDYRFGAPTETTDINGQKIRFTLDEKGRMSSVTGPYELEAGKPYTIKMEYDPPLTPPKEGNSQAGGYALTKHYDPEHNRDIKTYTFIDGLGRPIQIKKTGVISPPSEGPGEEVMIVSGRINYDAFGRAVESYYPVTEALGSETTYNPAVDAVSPSLTQYDILDRPVMETLPDGSQSKTEYTIDIYNGSRVAKTTQTDPMGNKSGVFTDALGRTVQSRQYSSGGDIVVTYENNALGEPLKVMDVSGNETLSEFDWLGRRTKVKHPDAGEIRMKYDLAGNPTERITAQIAKDIPNGGAIKYDYDYNRLKTISYPKNYRNNVSYSYGEPGAKNNRAGRLYLVTDASGGRELFFGKLGEVTKEIRTVSITSANIQTYISEYEYDTWNRIKKMIYPDGEVVTYGYNIAGSLQKVWGEKLNRSYPYIDYLGYDKFEQRSYLKYGNGTETNYTYDPLRRRLSNLKVSSSPSGTKGTIMDNAYIYDAMNNVLSVSSPAGGTLPSFGGAGGGIGGASSHSYEYDDLYRLVKAQGSFTGTKGQASYRLEMGYDQMYNITQKRLAHQVYGDNPQETNYILDYNYRSDKPHALANINEKLTTTANQTRNYSYTYDENGNMTGYHREGSFREMLWDEENRLSAVNDNGLVSQYTYDDTGERVLKSSGGIESIFVNGASAGSFAHQDNYTGYVSPYFVFKKGSFTKHIYAGTQRIVSQLGNGTFNNNSGLNGNGITAGGINFAQLQSWQDQQIEQYLAGLGIPPGPPTLKGIYGSPEYTGKPWPDFGTPLNDSQEPPLGWPKVPVFNEPGDVPGPPIQWGEGITNDNVHAGWGFDGTGALPENDRFFYHPDHLGSTSYVTTASGKVSQHVEYIPFGETLVEEHTNTWQSPYLFNAKERDEETGWSYYGARYYDPKLSVWLSVDPLAGYNPVMETEHYIDGQHNNGVYNPGNLNPYIYCYQNPVRYIDPNGKQVDIVTETKGTGHTFIIVNDISGRTVYNYGRYIGGSWYTGTTAGPGILIRYTGQEADKYIKNELYKMEAKVFRIKDADQNKVKKFLDNKYNSGSKVTTGTSNVKKYGREIDTYFIFSNNCTTISIEAVKTGGTSIFNNDGFIIPESLQDYLEKSGSSNVENKTNYYKNIYSNSNNTTSMGSSAGSAGTTSGAGASSSGASSNNPSTGEGYSSGSGIGSSSN